MSSLSNFLAPGGVAVYPAAGIPVSTGSAWTTSKTAPSGDIVGTSDTQTLTNKTYGNGNAAPITFLWSTSAATKDGISIYGRNGGTATYRVTITNSALSANRTQTLPDLNGEFILDIGAQQLRSKTLRAPNFIEDVDGDETRDGIIVTGRSGGTSSRRVTIIPTTLTANRTATLPDAAGTFVLDTATQTLTNKTLTTPIATGILETRVAMGANDVNLASGNYFTKTLSAGSVSLTVSNVPSTGTVASFILDLTNGGLATITWFTGIKWAGGTAPTLTSSGRDALGFFTHDGGTTWNGLLLGKDLK